MHSIDKELLENQIAALKTGYTKVQYKERTYGVSKSDFNKGKSIKVYAEELGGTDFISFNYYSTLTKNPLKPCEMPTAKVLHFLENYRNI